ncbi:MAG: MFS transporter [Deltaproteobacteria bacterium]|nr:MFS transporter [Deltaproteobacteria bacterium]
MKKRFHLEMFNYYGWVIIAISFLGFMVFSLSQQTITIFMKSILVEFKTSRAAAFLGISISCVVAGFSGTLAGALSDRFGSRWVLCIGGILHGIAICSVALVHSTWQFYLAYGLLASFFSSFVGIMPLISVLSNWFKRYRGTAMTMAFVGIGASKLFAGPIEQVMTTWGWRGVFVFLGIICPFLISPWAALFFVQKPEERGSVPDGFRFRLVEQEKPGEAPGAAKKQSRVIATTLSEAVRTHQFWMLSVAQFITPMGAQVAFYHFGTHLQDVGYTAGQVAHIWGNLMLAAAIATPCFGWISDRVSRWSVEKEKKSSDLLRLFDWSPLVPRLLVLTAAYVLTSLGILLLSWIQDTSNAILLWMFIIIFGGSYTIRGPMFFAITSDLFEGPEQGKILGASQMFQRFGMALAPWWGGWMFDVLGSYHQAFYLGIACLMAACLCSWLMGVQTRTQKEVLAQGMQQ